MTFLRACVEQVEAYLPGEQPPDGAVVTKLNTNENPYPPSPRCAEAVAAELSGQGERLRLYSDPAALALRRAAALAFGVSPDQVLHGNGSDELLVMLLRAFVDPGQRVAYPSPTYVLYETLARAHGARVEPHSFGGDFSLPRSLRASAAKLFFLASPSSPSGNSHPSSAIAELAAARPDSLVVVDEAYADFADETALRLVGEVPNLVVLRTLSKSYSLAGMRVGLLVASAELVASCAKVKDSYNLDRLAIVAGAAALSDAGWMQENVERVQSSRRKLSEGLRALGLAPLPSQANFVFVRVGSAERAHGAFQALKAQNILVRYFAQPGLDDGLRITVGTDAQVQQLLVALKACLVGM